jgi:hypothetical protein
MGQARNRGTREQRVAAAIDRDAAAERQRQIDRLSISILAARLAGSAPQPAPQSITNAGTNQAPEFS